MTDDSTTEYAGPERRHIQTTKLEDALKEVTRLNEAATVLSTAVVNTAQRRELLQLQDDVKQNLRLMAGINAALTFLIILFLVVYINGKTNEQTRKIRTNYGVITCLLGKTEAQRTADLQASALISCEQTTRR